MANYKEISPEDADSLISCGVPVEYCNEKGFDDWAVWSLHSAFTAVEYFKCPPYGACFRVLVE